MKILILGHADSGKDEVAKLINKFTGLSFGSSSEIALKEIWDGLVTFADLTETGIDDYSTATPENIEKVMDRKKKDPILREVMKNLISLYNKPDRTALARKILEKHDIYVGMRCHKEYSECERLFDHIIWVDASTRVGNNDKTMGITYYAQDMHLINNNGSIHDLDRIVRDFLKKAKIIPTVPLPPVYPNVADLIVNWADEVFPERTVDNALKKMVFEEIPEFMLTRDTMELADIAILLYDIANLLDVNLDQAIREKMTINKSRNWQIDKVTGLLNHVE
jgi:predicted house-cleaning noncanonical NTP pyrophosphatase (MazG superfamily)